MANNPENPEQVMPTTGVTVSDIGIAPYIFFEVASNIGFANGIVNVILAAARHLIKEGSPHSDIVSVAYLRCNLTAAIGLRDALNGAILLGTKQLGGAQ
jgi:hypothetical protein